MIPRLHIMLQKSARVLTLPHLFAFLAAKKFKVFLFVDRETRGYAACLPLHLPSMSMWSDVMELTNCIICWMNKKNQPQGMINKRDNKSFRVSFLVFEARRINVDVFLVVQLFFIVWLRFIILLKMRNYPNTWRRQVDEMRIFGADCNWSKVLKRKICPTTRQKAEFPGTNKAFEKVKFQLSSNKEITKCIEFHCN